MKTLLRCSLFISIICSSLFTSSQCEDVICPEEIVANPITDYVEFYIPCLGEGIIVTWNFGDGTILVDDWYTEHLYQCEQFCSYTVTASFVDPDCPDGGGGPLTLTLQFDFDSPYYCPEGILVNAIDCNTFEFGYDPSPYTDEIYWYGTWFVNGTYYAQDFSYFPGMLQIEFDEPGIYEVSVELYCYGSYQIYTMTAEVEVEVEECGNGICPDSIITTQLSINIFQFFIEGIDEGQPVTWNFGDGTEVVDDASIEHEFAEGTFLVTATFMDADCPWDGPTILSTEVTVFECSLELTAVDNGEGSFTFTATGTPVELPMYWDFGDGTTLEATWVTDHVFEPGDYTVCCWIYTEQCDADSLLACTDVSVVDCPDTIVYEGFPYCELNIPELSNNVLVDWSFDFEDFDEDCLNMVGIENYADAPTTVVYWTPKFCSTVGVCFTNDSLVAIGCPMYCQSFESWDFCYSSVDEIPGLSISLFPNPTSDHLTITLDTNPDQLEAKLIDSTGRLVLSQSISARTTSIDVSGLASGLYILKLSGDSMNETRQIEIAR